MALANILKKTIRTQNKKSKFEVTEITDNIFHLTYDKEDEMCTAFCRLQEYYESPFFKGKIFTIEEFAIWYNGVNKKKKFTYHEDWSGFNIPSYVLRPFYNEKFKNITVQERQILDYFKNHKGKFYIIATPKGYSEKDNREVIHHEIGHALYYTNKNYKNKVDEVLDNILNDKDREVFKEKFKLSYNKKVHQDETHAYILANIDYLEDEILMNKRILSASKKLNKIYKLALAGKL